MNKAIQIEFESLIEHVRNSSRKMPLVRCGAVPTPEHVRRIVELISLIAFPGLSISNIESEEELRRFLSGVATQFQHGLSDLLFWSEYQVRPADAGHVPTIVITETIQKIFLKLPELIDRLHKDVEAACLGDPACRGPQEVVICYPGFRAIVVHRLSHELYNLNFFLAARILSEWAHGETGIDIHPGASIGEYFFIDHGTGVVIGETCHVGNHVKVYQGVTLGALSFSKDDTGKIVREAKRHPTIEDYVVIYAGATVLGGQTTIGHHSVIGGSVWLTGSVSPYSTIVIEKPRLRIRTHHENRIADVQEFQI